MSKTIDKKIKKIRKSYNQMVDRQEDRGVSFVGRTEETWSFIQQALSEVEREAKNLVIYSIKIDWKCLKTVITI